MVKRKNITDLNIVPTYNQSSVPSSPANGETWRELDATNGFPITIWQYDLANTRWIEWMPRSWVWSIVSNTANTSTATGIALPYNSTSFIIDTCRISVIAATTQTGSVSWNLSVNKMTSPNATAGTTIASINTSGISATTWTVSPVARPNLLVSDTESINFNSSVAAGTPGQIRAVASVFYRGIRA